LERRERPPRNAASDVTAWASVAIVTVGMSNHVNNTGDGVDMSLYEPLHVKGAVVVSEGEDEVVVRKGKCRCRVLM
jgi:hypothetical protein